MSNQSTWFTTTAGQQTFVLPVPASAILSLYWNGLLQPPDTYSLASDQVTVTINFQPADGDALAIGFQVFVAPSPPPPQPPIPAISSFSPPGPSGLINVGEVVVDPDLAQPFTILRSAGIFVNGVWKSTETKLQTIGVISVASEGEVNMLPEGDVILGARVFHTDQPIFKTQEGKGSSDILIWRDQKYRVLRVAQYQDYGYWRAIASRMSTGT